jgi:hypothetical protein
MVMVGLMSGNNDFSWDDSTIFDKIGNPETREEFLQDLSGTGNNKRELIKQLRSMDESEMKQILYQLPEEGKDEFVKTYFGLDSENMSNAPEMTITGPETAPSSGMMAPLELNASVNF